MTFDSSFTFANNISNYANTFDSRNVTDKWTRDGADRRLYFVTSGSWALPIGKGQKFVGNAAGTVDKLVSGWTLQAILTLASGQYYSPLFTGSDPANSVVGQVTELPDCIGDPNAGARTKNLWFNPKAFAIPPANAGRYGTCGMNVLEGYPVRRRARRHFQAHPDRRVADRQPDYPGVRHHQHAALHFSAEQSFESRSGAVHRRVHGGRHLSVARWVPPDRREIAPGMVRIDRLRNDGVRV